MRVLFLVILLAACNRSPEPAGLPPMAEEGIAATVAAADRAMREGDYATASREIDTAFVELDRDGEHGPALLASAYNVRGLVRTEMRDLPGATADLERARSIDRASHDDDGYALSTEALAAAYDYADRFAESEALFRELVELTRRLDGEGSAEHARAIGNLGINLQFQERCADARPALERSATMLTSVAPLDPALDGALLALGNCAHLEHDLEAALGYYRRAHAVRQAREPRHPRMAVVKHNLAAVLLELGRRDEARTYAAEAVALRAVLPADHPWRVESEALLEQTAGND